MDTTQQPTVEFAQLVSRGCGLDVHKDVLVATIQGQGLMTQTRSFGAFTQDIEQLAGWLRTHQVTHVAMESTATADRRGLLEACFQRTGRGIRDPLS
jgi:hypothetical protein